MKFSIVRKNYLCRPDRLDIPVPAIPGERVGEWVERFTSTTQRSPKKGDFLKHNVFVSFTFIDPYQYKWQKVVPVHARAKEICSEHYGPKDWFITPEGSVWMTTEEEILMFKLYW